MLLHRLACHTMKELTSPGTDERLEPLTGRRAHARQPNAENQWQRLGFKKKQRQSFEHLAVWTSRKATLPLVDLERDTSM